MILDGQIVGRPLISYKDTKAAIEALTGVVAGMTAYATDTNLTGYYTGVSWVWGVGSSGSTILALPQYHFFVGGSSGSAEDAGTGITYNPATNRLSLDNVQWNLTPTPVAPAEGLMYWNSDDGTLNLGMPGGDVNLQLGQEMLMRAKNETGSPITNGQLVYISGGTGSNAIVSLAQANAELSSAATIGMATETIADNQFGYITLSGMVRDINTSGSAAGTVLYLSPTVAGEYTGNKPVAPNHLVSIGVIIRSHATEGVVFVRVDNGFEISELHDVYINSVSDGQILQYINSNSRWENKSVLGDASLSSSGSLVLATVNSNVGSFTNASITVNAKGLITAASSGTAPVTGIGTPGRVAQWATSSALGDSNLISSGAGVLTLSAAGIYTLTVPATGTTLLRDANIAAGRVAFGSDANTLSGYSGFIWNDTTHRLLIDPGATAPDSPLTIRGNGTVLGATGIEYVMNFNSGAGSYPGMFFGYHSANNLGVLGVTSTGAATDLAFYMLTSGTWSERMRLTNAGRLGVGCTPSFYIHSAGNAAFGNAGVNTAGQTVVDTSSSHARIYQFNSGATLTNLIQTGGVTYFNGGSVAIGATSAGAKLDVVGTVDAIQLRVTGFTTQGNVVAQFLRNDGATNTAGTILTLGANSTGALGVGFGGAIALNLESSTTTDQIGGKIEWVWNVATHGSAVSDMVLSAAYNSGAAIVASEFLRGRGNAGIIVTGSQTGTYTTTAVDLTLTAAHHWVRVTAAKTITLPTAVGISGREYIITATVNNVIVDAATTELINGSLTQVLLSGDSIQIKSDGAGWKII